MAPRRLINKGALREGAMLHRNDGTWESVRFKIIARTPTVLIDYFFEVLLAFLAVFGSIINFIGLQDSSVTRFMPGYLVDIYSALLMLGAGTVLVGLRIRRYGTLLPMGLRLLSGVCAGYALAVIFAAGFTAGATVIGNAGLIAAVAGWRAFILRSTFILVEGDKHTGAPIP